MVRRWKIIIGNRVTESTVRMYIAPSAPKKFSQKCTIKTLGAWVQFKSLPWISRVVQILDCSDSFTTPSHNAIFFPGQNKWDIFCAFNRKSLACEQTLAERVWMPLEGSERSCKERETRNWLRVKWPPLSSLLFLPLMPLSAVRHILQQQL